MINISRKINFINKKYIDKKYRKIINYQTIESLNLIKVKKLILKEDSDLQEIILHNVINEWINKNYKESISFLSRLKKIIKKYKINLDVLENQEITLLEERIFSKERHIKVLLVESHLSKNENAGAKFVDASLFVKNPLLRNIMTGELILTNLKIIFSETTNINTFPWKQITKIQYNDFGFLFEYDKKEYLIRIHDQISLNNTIKNFLSKKVKKQGWINK